MAIKADHIYHLLPLSKSSPEEIKMGIIALLEIIKAINDSRPSDRFVYVVFDKHIDD